MQDHPIIITVYDNARTTMGDIEALSWSDLVELCSVHEVLGKPNHSGDMAALDRHKQAANLFYFGEMSPSGRGKSYVQGVYGATLDIDNASQAQQEAALAILEPYHYHAYSTHKSGASAAGGARRIRILIPFAQPLLMESTGSGPNYQRLSAQYNKIWFHLHGLIGEIADPKAKDCARLNYFPSTFDPDLAWTHQNIGSVFFDWSQVDFRAPSKQRGEKVTQSQAQASTKALRAWFNAPTGRLTKDSDEFSGALVEASAKLVAAGEPYAAQDSGRRHNMMRHLTWCIAAQFPDTDSDCVRDLFETSIDSMEQTHDTPPPTIDAVVQAFETAVQKVREAQTKGVLEKAQESRENKKLVDEHLPENNKYDKYNSEELNQLMGFCGAKDLDELGSRWIVQHKNLYFVLTLKGYKGPFTAQSLQVAASKFLSRAPEIMLYKSVSGGGTAPTSTNELTVRYGTHAEILDYNMVDQVSTLSTLPRDPDTLKLSVAMYPHRFLEPVYHEKVNKWLWLMGGERNYDRLVDWMAVATDLSQPICALYFTGPKHVGKTLMAHGLSAVWSPTRTPAKAENVIGGQFQDELLECPIIFADEQMPTTRARIGATAQIRELIGSRSITINQKGIKPLTARGCVRLILAANDRNMIKDRGAKTREAVEALAERVLLISLKEEVREYLYSLTQADRNLMLEKWIGEHALWLKENHHVDHDPSERLIVPAGDQPITYLMGASIENRNVYHWLGSYLMNPEKYEQACSDDGLILRTEKGLFVQPKALYLHWDLYLKTKADTPEVNDIRDSLNVMSHRSLRKKFHGVLGTYYEINIETLIQFCQDELGFGDEEVMRRSLLGPAGRRQAAVQNIRREELEQAESERIQDETDMAFNALQGFDDDDESDRDEG